MKKIALFSMLVLLVPGVSFAGSVDTACYAVKGWSVTGPYCGGKTAAKWVGTGVGGFVGGRVGTIFGPVGMVGGAIAGGYVGHELGGKIGRNYSANEYLYFEDGSCIECDSHQMGEDFECPNRTVVTNGTHTYMCHVEGGGDYWSDYTIPYCQDSLKPSDIKEGKKYKTIVRDNITNNGKEVYPGVIKYSGNVCIFIEEDCSNCGGDNTIVDPIKQKTCKQKRSTEEGKACCDLPEKEAQYDEKTGKCNCDGGKEFKIVNGKGQCVEKDAPDEPVVGDKNCKYYLNAEIKCANGNSYLEKGEYDVDMSKIDRSKFNGKTCDDVKSWLNEDLSRLTDLFKDLCKTSDNLVIIDNRKVEDAQNVLNVFTASAKEETSVWKTAEGKFNTTRLASDITAGVVLGTVGGVVTGNVIKKNQVKKGFEALHCTVGGQKVADWGDEFNVGLRR